MNETFLPLASKEYPLGSATKPFSSPWCHSFRIRLLPCNRSSKGFPSSSRRSILEPSEKVNVTEDKEISSGFADSESFCENTRDNASCHVWGVFVVVVDDSSLAKSSGVHSDPVWRVGEDCIKGRGFELWKNFEKRAMADLNSDDLFLTPSD